MSASFAELSTGLYPGGEVVMARFYAATTDFNGTSPQPVTVISVDMEPQDGETEPFTQMYSVGKGWVPNKAGTGIDPIKGRKGETLSGSSNFGLLLKSLFNPLDDVNNGFDKTKVGDDLSVFNGIRCRTVRKEKPKFTGKRSGGGGLTAAQAAPVPAADPDKDNTILLVAEILEFPKGYKGAKASGATTAAAPAKGRAKAAPEPEEDAVDPAIRKRASKMVVALLKDETDGMTAIQLGKAIFKQLKGDDDQAVISQLVNDEAFLSDSAAPWEYNGEVVKL